MVEPVAAGARRRAGPKDYGGLAGGSSPRLAAAGEPGGDGRARRRRATRRNRMPEVKDGHEKRTCPVFCPRFLPSPVADRVDSCTSPAFGHSFDSHVATFIFRMSPRPETGLGSEKGRLGPLGTGLKCRFSRCSPADSRGESHSSPLVCFLRACRATLAYPPGRDCAEASLRGVF